MIPELPDDIRAIYPFGPHWVDAGGYTLHYVDEGPHGSDAVVLLHGNPTWSFLYRDVIPRIAAAGVRVVAPDYLGCGRSDHGRREAEYAISHHIARTLATLEAAGVERAVFFCQDWGGPIGLGMALARPGLLAGLVLGNTFWGEASSYHRRIVPWRAIHAPVAGPLLFGRTRTFLNALRLAGPRAIHSGPAWRAYSLPFDVHGGAGSTLAWPRAISLGAGHPTQPLADAIWEEMPHMEVPVRLVWGEDDVVFPAEEQGRAFQERLPRGAEHPMHRIAGGNHFVQEYAPEACAGACIEVAKEVLA